MVVLGYNNKKVHQRYTYEDEVKYLVHNQGIEKMPVLKICKDIDDLEKLTLNFYTQKNISSKMIDNKRKYFLFDDKLKYKDRLKNIVDQIIKKKYS
jgi:hypothetical protein